MGPLKETFQKIIDNWNMESQSKEVLVNPNSLKVHPVSGGTILELAHAKGDEDCGFSMHEGKSYVNPYHAMESSTFPHPTKPPDDIMGDSGVHYESRMKIENVDIVKENIANMDDSDMAPAGDAMQI